MAFLLHQLLQESAKRYPDKEAVVCRDKHLTYSDLDKLSNQLAHALIVNGIRKGDRIGFCLNKSLESIVSIFAILKAGCVYVPIDPRSPAKRMGFILNNCGISALISSNEKLKTVEEVLGCTKTLEVTVAVDDKVDSGIAGLSQIKSIAWPEVTNSPFIFDVGSQGIDRDLAYILYTSGSTGDPKGVMISHQTSLTFVNWSYEEFGIESVDRVSSHAPLHFDLSIFDIFTSIKAGATVFLVPEEYSVFPKSLIKFIQEKKITVWYSVPSILVHLMVHGNLKSNTFPDLRLILFAGEVFPIKYLRNLMEIIPGAKYFNLYGPTETNVCTFYPVKPIDADQTKPIPIGKACRNTEVFILNEDKRLITKPGELGELCARGSCVAQGYWGDIKKAHSNFVENSLQADFDDTMYRTGDLVFMDEEGNYHLVGRKDHMIKSRGYRIELGEIESALYSHPDVKEAAVVAVPDDLITNKIKAFVVPVCTNSLTKVEIDKYLSERIPQYMIPELVEFRDSLPKTSTGKIDRTNLANR